MKNNFLIKTLAALTVFGLSFSALINSPTSPVQVNAQTSNCQAASGAAWNPYSPLVTDTPNPQINNPCRDMPLMSFFPIDERNNNPRSGSFLAGEQFSTHLYYNPNGNQSTPRAGIEIIRVSDTQYRITGALSSAAGSLSSSTAGGDLLVNVPAGYAPVYVANTTKWYPQRQTRSALASSLGLQEDIIIPDTRGNGFTYNNFIKRQDSIPSFPTSNGVNISYKDTDRNAQRDTDTPDNLNSASPFSEYGYILTSFLVQQVQPQNDNPNLNITKSANKVQVIGGEEIVYTLNYSNTGNVNLTNVVITDTLDSKVDFVSCTNNCNSTALPRLEWNIGNLNVGQNASLTYTVRVKAGATGIIPNIARISSTETPEKPSNEVRIPILQPGLNITKSANKVQVVGGEEIVYTINYSNTGNTPQTSVRITDTLDSKVDFVSCTNNCNSTALPRLEWNIGGLVIGASGTVSYTVRVKAGATGIIPNIARISSTETPEKPSNEVRIPILQPGLGITKAVDKDLVNIRDRVTYTLNYSNTGSQTLSDVKITDELDIRLEYVTDSCGTNCSYDPSTRKITWNIGNLTQNQTGSVKFETIVAATATGTIPNVALISATSINPITSNEVVIRLNIPANTPRTGGPAAALIFTLVVIGFIAYFYYKQRQGKFKDKKIA